MNDFKLSATHIGLMLNLQKDVNDVSKPDWLHDNPDYNLAAVVELVEGIGHTPWKWWKDGKLDKARAFMEIVDTLHFVLSDSLVKLNRVQGNLTIEVINQYSDTLQRALNAANCNKYFEYDQKKFQYITKGLILNILLGKRSLDNYEMLLCLTYLLGYTQKDLFTSYIGKNVLNHFRQENDYTKGTYIKIWGNTKESGDQEDNDFLQAFLNENINLKPSDLVVAARNYLSQKYQEVLNNEKR